MSGVQITTVNNLGEIRTFIWEDVILQVMGCPTSSESETKSLNSLRAKQFFN